MGTLVLITGLIGYAIYFFKIKPLPPAERKRMLIRLVVILLCALLVLGAAMGKVHWLGGIAAAVVGALRLGLLTGLSLGRFWWARTGGVARFSTAFIDAQFDAQRLSVSGRIKKGLHAGADLAQLSQEQLEALVEYYAQQDKKSYYLIRAVLHRRGFSHEAPPPDSSALPARQEALAILGLEGNPSRQDILQAHRRLIHKLHPDRGGNDFLASQVNLARDTLLKTLNDTPE
jgi:hypothetical protein